MYSKLIILKNIESDKDEELVNRFNGFSGEVSILQNFNSNLFEMQNNNELGKYFNFSLIQDIIYVQINSDIMINNSLIDKFNSNKSIKYNSDELNIIRINDNEKVNIVKGVDYNDLENIKLEITPKINYDNVTTLLFIHKQVSFQSIVLNRLIKSIKHGNLKIYCYIDGLEDIVTGFADASDIELVTQKLTSYDEDIKYLRDKLDKLKTPKIKSYDGDIIKLKNEIDKLNGKIAKLEKLLKDPLSDFR